MTKFFRDQNRRKFIKQLTASSGSLMLSPSLFTRAALGETAGRSRLPGQKFVLYVHCGSWDGLTSGLVQPRDAGDWPVGTFVAGQKTGSANPNVNRHFKDGSLVFNAYSAVLQPISDNLCFGVADAASLDHVEAAFYTSSGGSSNMANSSWLNGIGQAVNEKYGVMAVTNTGNDNPGRAVKGNVNTLNVVPITAVSIDQFVTGFQDRYDKLPATATGNRFWEALAAMDKLALGLPADHGNLQQTTASFVQNLVRGAPELAASSPIVAGVQSAINATRITQVLDSLAGNFLPTSEINLIKPGTDSQYGARDYNTFNGSADSLLDQLQLAAALAKTGFATGMSILMHHQDFHNTTYGNGSVSSSVDTPRNATRMWAALRVFWEWVIVNGLKDDVMVVVSHEFSRTSYNSSKNTQRLGVFNGTTEQQVDIQTSGTDHNKVAGVCFINGKVPGKSRIGALGDHNTAQPSVDLTGHVNNAAGLPPFSMTQLVGSMFLRCFDDILKDQRDAKRFWANFETPIDFLVG